MGLWLFIGVVFAAFLLLALWRSRRHKLMVGNKDDEANERRREADVMAADAARAAEARIAPNPSGFPF